MAGHSLGGAIVQCLALGSPEWLARIILVGTGARLRVAPAILDRLSPDSSPAWETGFKSATDTICDYAFGPSASPSMIQAAREDFLKNSPEVFHGDYLACDQFDIMENVGKISLPALIISGGADSLTPVKYGEYLYNHIPEAEISVIEDGGHMMGLEKPEEFTERIRSFLFGRARR